jgi:hypothetical protein
MPKAIKTIKIVFGIKIAIAKSMPLNNYQNCLDFGTKIAIAINVPN